MKTKICNKCNRELDISEFAKSTGMKSGFLNKCRECKTQQRREYRLRSNINQLCKDRYHNDPEYRQQVLKRCAKLQNKKRPQLKIYNTNYYKKHKEKMHIQSRAWRANNKLRIHKWLHVYYKDPVRRIALNMRNRVRIAIATQLAEKSQKTEALCGCTWSELVIHLEKQFKPGMSWSNYGRHEGKWSIDHIIPCSAFDLLKPEEQAKCFHYTNLQPLWTSENSAKRNN